ncbi:uncharacterized protein V6R79_022738 [Siganus canaliculatus]
MAQKSDYQFSIREYRPTDEHEVMSLFRFGVLEHIYPAFFKAMSHPDHIGITLSISMAGYVLGGSSYFQAFLFGSAWAGLIYYCCQEIYEGYMKRRLDTDMADIPANYLENPDNSFWVAEAADVNGRAKVVGIVAVTGKRGGEDGCNGGVMGGGADLAGDGGHGGHAGHGGHGELSYLVVRFPWRRKGLGSQLMSKALDFCKERGYAHLVLDVTSPQTSASSLCQRNGFVQTACHSKTHANRFFSKLARINVLRMEKSV